MHLLKHSNNRSVFKRLTYLIITSSFLFNFAWEMLQMPLYEDMRLNMQTAIFCGLASVADAIMVLLIYFVLALIYKDPLWIKHLNLKRTLIIVLLGGTGAVLAEIGHLSQDNWAYASSMPIIPFINVGLSPILQFMFLPVLSYYLSFYLSKKNYGSQTN